MVPIKITASPFLILRLILFKRLYGPEIYAAEGSGQRTSDSSCLWILVFSLPSGVSAGEYNLEVSRSDLMYIIIIPLVLIFSRLGPNNVGK